MIVAVSIEDAHLYGDIIPSIYRLRFHGFKERQNYAVPSYRGMEYDSYDTPATTYLAWRDDAGIVRGCARLFPTTRPYMIEEIWPQSIEGMAPPKAENIWESSRLCIDKNLAPTQRKKILGEILCALQEFGLREDIAWMLGVMTPPIWRAVFVNFGWPITFMGSPLDIGEREKILAGRMNISPLILRTLRQRFEISAPVLVTRNDEKFRKTA